MVFSQNKWISRKQRALPHAAAQRACYLMDKRNAVAVYSSAHHFFTTIGVRRALQSFPFDAFTSMAVLRPCANENLFRQYGIKRRRYPSTRMSQRPLLRGRLPIFRILWGILPADRTEYRRG